MLSYRKSVVPIIVAVIVIIAGVAATSVMVWRGINSGARAASLPYNATANGPYRVVGNTIVGADGKQYIFHGIGRDGLEYNCFGEGPLDKQSLSYMGSGTNTAKATYWGANTVRLPLSEGFWLHGSTTNSCSAVQYQALVKQTVDNLTALRLNVIIDLQWVDADGQSGQGGGPWPSPDADSVTFWGQVATLYQGYSNVLFELYNEPYATWQCWAAGCTYTNYPAYSDDCECTKNASYTGISMQALVDAVRGTGANNLVIVGGVDWGYSLLQLDTYALTGTNLVYDTHPYPYSDKMPTAWNGSFGHLSSKYAMISAENGQYDCASDYVSQLYDYLDELGIGWVAWAWYAQPSGSHANVCGYPQLIYDYSGTPTASTGQYIYQRLRSYAPAPVPTPIPTPGPRPVQNGYNNIGISANNATGAANYDGVGYSYSASALLAAGIAPGRRIVTRNFTFTWPNVIAGRVDNYASRGQTLNVVPVRNARYLGLLGSATMGATSGVLTIVYTDKSMQTVGIGFTDWARATPAYGNLVVAKMLYRNGRSGPQSLAVYLFSTAMIALRPGKTISYIILPVQVRGKGQIHIFAVATR